MTLQPPPPRRPRPASRRGATFIEIMIAMAILAACLVPISSMLVGTAGQTASTKAESSAASYSAKLMNYFLDELPFDHELIGNLGAGEEKTVESEDVDAGEHPGIGGSDIVIDGTRLRWTLVVRVIPNADITPVHRLIHYHDPREVPCDPQEAWIGANASAGDPDSYSTLEDSKSVVDLDKKNQEPVLKEFRLTVQWRTPRDATFEDIATPPHKRTVTLLTRRARL